MMLRKALLFFLLLPLLSEAQENCSNGLDDDGDGLIDRNDSLDCPCVPHLSLWNPPMVNPGFEEHTACPVTYSDMNLAVGWSQATYATSDLMDQCGWFPAWVPLPLPDGGNACAGGYVSNGYEEFIGTWLLDTLKAGVTYTLGFHMAGFNADSYFLIDTDAIDFADLEVTLYGAWDHQFMALNFGCPLSYGFHVLGTANHHPDGLWSPVQITFTPLQDVNTLMIGGPCVVDPTYPSSTSDHMPYFLYDAFTMYLGDTSAVPVTMTGNLCTNDLELIAPENPGMQWYLNGGAVVGATQPILAVSSLGLGAGLYEVMVQADSSCLSTAQTIEAPVYPEANIVVGVNTLTCTSPGTYQWYLNGTPIPGAIDSSYTMVEAGEYSVLVTNPEGCSTLSAPYDIALPIAEKDHGGVICSHSSGTDLVALIGMHQPFEFRLLDLAGKQLLQGKGTSHYFSFDLGGFPDGMYIIMLEDRAFRLMR